MVLMYFIPNLQYLQWYNNISIASAFEALSDMMLYLLFNNRFSFEVDVSMREQYLYYLQVLYKQLAREF